MYCTYHRHMSVGSIGRLAACNLGTYVLVLCSRRRSKIGSHRIVFRTFTTQSPWKRLGTNQSHNTRCTVTREPHGEKMGLDQQAQERWSVLAWMTPCSLQVSACDWRLYSHCPIDQLGASKTRFKCQQAYLVRRSCTLKDEQNFA